MCWSHDLQPIGILVCSKDHIVTGTGLAASLLGTPWAAAYSFHLCLHILSPSQVLRSGREAGTRSLLSSASSGTWDRSNISVMYVFRYTSTGLHKVPPQQCQQWNSRQIQYFSHVRVPLHQCRILLLLHTCSLYPTILNLWHIQWCNMCMCYMVLSCCYTLL